MGGFFEWWFDPKSDVFLSVVVPVTGAVVFFVVYGTVELFKFLFKR